MKIYYIGQRTIKWIVLVTLVLVLGMAAWDTWRARLAPPPSTMASSLLSPVSPKTKGLNSYKIDVTFDPVEHKLQAVQTVDYTNDEATALKELYFHLYPNAFADQSTAPFEEQDMTKAYPNGFSEGKLEIKTVNVNGVPVPFSIEGQDKTIMRLTLPFILPAGQKAKIDMEYEVILPNCLGRFGYGQHTFNITNWYPILAVYDENGWNIDPYYAIGDPFYSDVADYSVTITAPSNFTIASTGVVVDRQKAGNKQIWSISAQAVRDFAWLASDQFMVSEKKAGETSVRSYYFSRSSGEKVLEYAADAISIFNQYFGLYPYRQFSVVQSDFFIGGMEYPNLVMVDQSLYTSLTRNILEYVTVHETAHQWWYGVVGNNEIDEPWLDEALTEYSTILYYEQKYGKKVKDQIFDSMVVGKYRNIDNFLPKTNKSGSIERPVYEFENSYIYDILVYGKGAIMLDQLRQKVGDEEFKQILQKYYAENAFENTTADKFINTCKDVSKMPLDDFFHWWLTGNQSQPSARNFYKKEDFWNICSIINIL